MRIIGLLAAAGLFAALGAAAQSSRFELLGPEVLDRQTGLVWQRCSVGLDWTGERCAGTADRFTWDDARGLGRDGWRLPEPDELATLLDRQRKEQGILPKIDAAAFPDMDPGDPLQYWSTGYHHCVSETRQGCGMAVEFNFNVNDDVVAEPRELRFRVRLVRSDTTQAAAAAATEEGVSADGRFELHGGVAYDRKTGLSWQRCFVGQVLQAGLGCTGLVERITYGDALRLPHDGWRLPDVNELKSLIDEGRMRARHAPYIDEAVFPITQPSDHAVLTGQPYGPTDVWCVDFGIGVPENCGRDHPHPVRLVRSGS